MKHSSMTDPLLRLVFITTKFAFQKLGSRQLKNCLGLKLWHWLTPFVEDSGYEWTIMNKNYVSERTRRAKEERYGNR